MNQHAALLQELLKKETLTPSEVMDGVAACFFATNRNFVKRRLNDASDEEVDAALSKLMARVFNDYRIDPAKPDIHLLKEAENALTDRTGFESEADLVKMHREIIQSLFTRAEK